MQFALRVISVLNIFIFNTSHGATSIEQYKSLKMESRLLRQEFMPQEPVEVELILRNSSRTKVIGCLSDNFTYEITTQNGFGAMGSSSSHPDCKEKFSLNPNGSFKFTRIVKMPAERGPAKLKLSIQILDPKTCGPMGCRGLSIESSQTLSFVVK